jgi:hypothetical protein
MNVLARPAINPNLLFVGSLRSGSLLLMRCAEPTPRGARDVAVSIPNAVTLPPAFLILEMPSIRDPDRGTNTSHA